MEYRRLGKAGVQVSAVSLGSYVTFGGQIADDVAADLMKTAYDHGINFFDNAETYVQGGAERVMGNILKDMGWSHETFLVSSKVFWGGKLPNQRGLCRKHVLAACENAMRRLHVDFLDFYYCHRPDPNTPIEETVRAMSDLIHQGKVLYWGTSEWSAQEITQAHAVARECCLVPPTMEQPQYNLFHRDRIEREYARLYGEYGLGATTFSPLAHGVLTGKHKEKPQEGTRATMKVQDAWIGSFIQNRGKEKAEQITKLGALAKELELSMAVLAIAWCLRNPNVSSVVLGASKQSQLIENIQAVEAQAKLSPEVLKRINDIVA